MKILLVMLLALSLYSDEGMFCDSNFKSYQKYSELLEFSNERADFWGMKINCALSIRYIESTIAECGREWYGRENAMKIRSNLLLISRKIKEVEERALRSQKH